MNFISFFKPNLRFIDLARALFLSEKSAKKHIENFFSELTGKKYILLTNSCRTALYLSYQSLGMQGEVITSPLTCKVAIDPIEATKNIPIFADINKGDLNISPDDISQRLTDKTIAVQAIHLGGVACDMDRILSILDKKNILLIEDCAQSLGAKYHGMFTGCFGDIACFSLIKNAYGIGGGVLATDKKTVYTKAKLLNDKFPKSPFLLIMFRVVRTLIATKRGVEPFTSLYNFIALLKGKRQSYSTILNQLRKISLVEKKIAAVQIKRFHHLQRERKKVGKQYREMLMQNKLMVNCQFDPDASSYTKFFLHHPLIKTQKHMFALGENGIEAMHLEEKSTRPYQNPIVRFNSATGKGLTNYKEVHDSMLSLPLSKDVSRLKIDEKLITVLNG